MSLRDEIIKEAESRENGFVVLTGDFAFSDEELDNVINKVLDAVDRKIDAEGGEFDPSDDLEKGYDDGLAAALKAVKQLRPES